MTPPPATSHTHTPGNSALRGHHPHAGGPGFVNEAKNAFATYNRNTFFNKPMTADLLTLDNDNRLPALSPFATAQDAINYVDKTSGLAASQIVPWLTAGKYAFAIISERTWNC